MSQELLSKQTDLIDRFGVLQIKLSNRGRRNREFIHIFDKNSRFSKVKDAEILSKKMHKINFNSKNTIRDIECYSESKDSNYQRKILIDFCERHKIDLLLHIAEGNSRGRHKTQVFIFFGLASFSLRRDFILLVQNFYSKFGFHF